MGRGRNEGWEGEWGKKIKTYYAQVQIPYINVINVYDNMY